MQNIYICYSNYAKKLNVMRSDISIYLFHIKHRTIFCMSKLRQYLDLEHRQREIIIEYYTMPCSYHVDLIALNGAFIPDKQEEYIMTDELIINYNYQQFIRVSYENIPGLVRYIFATFFCYIVWVLIKFRWNPAIPWSPNSQHQKDCHAS